MTALIILNWDQYETRDRPEFSPFTVSPVPFKWKDFFSSPWSTLAVQFTNQTAREETAETLQSRADHLTALSPVEMKWIIVESGPHNETRNWTCDGPLIMWFTVIVFSLTFTFPGALVILIDSVLKRRQKIPFSPHDVFMINLTAMDLIYSTVLSTDMYFGDNYEFADFDFFRFFSSLCFVGRPLLLTCISVDTYIAVVHPVTYRARKNLASRLLIIAGVWIGTTALGCYFLVYKVELYGDIPTLFLAVTLSIITLCDFSIFWTLKKPGPGGKNINPRKKKALRIIINKSIITFLSYFPFLMDWLLENIMKVSDGYFFCTFFMPTLCFTVAGNTVSVILHVSNLDTLDWLKVNVCVCLSLFTS